MTRVNSIYFSHLVVNMLINMDSSIENTLSVTETLAFILTFDRDGLDERLSCVRSIWEEGLILDAAGFLPVEDGATLLHLIADQNQEVSNHLSEILALPDKDLFLGLTQIRLDRCQAILRAAAKLLSQAEVEKLKKMIILQNISTSKTTDKPWEKKKSHPKPSRTVFSKELIARTLTYS